MTSRVPASAGQSTSTHSPAAMPVAEVHTSGFGLVMLGFVLGILPELPGHTATWTPEGAGFVPRLQIGILVPHATPAVRSTPLHSRLVWLGSHAVHLPSDGHDEPHADDTSATQLASHAPVQHEGCCWHTLPTHASHVASSAPPA